MLSLTAFHCIDIQGSDVSLVHSKVIKWPSFAARASPRRELVYITSNAGCSALSHSYLRGTLLSFTSGEPPHQVPNMPDTPSAPSGNASQLSSSATLLRDTSTKPQALSSASSSMPPPPLPTSSRKTRRSRQGQQDEQQEETARRDKEWEDLLCEELCHMVREVSNELVRFSKETPPRH